ncbi:MAG: YtxH domain-containing protein [Bacilli bacterium]
MMKMSKECNCKKKHGFGKFLAGLGLGAAVGVLFAPKSGSETRKELKIKLDELLDNLNEVDAEEVKEYVEAKIYEIKEAIEDLDKEKVIKIAKKKAAEIADMADELVDYTIEKGTPIIESAAADIRAKAVEVTKEVLDKLEKE